MTLIAFELNDAALAAVTPDGLALPEPGYAPGYAAAINERVCFGIEARQQARLHPRSTTNRFWHEFSDTPLAQPVGPHATSLDLVHAHLAELLDELGARPSGIIFTIPPYWQPEQLGWLLGLAEELALPVHGLVDSAVAAVRREYPGQRLLLLAGSLHETTVTRLSQDGRIAVAARETIDGPGIAQLERTCAAAIAARFLDATRFDPLHDARSEQFLYDRLHDWLRQVGREPEAAVAIEFGGNEFCATITRADLAALSVQAFDPALRSLRGQLVAGEPAAILVTDRLATFPGIVDALGRLPQASVYVLEPAAAAHGAVHRAAQFAPTDAGVGLTTTLHPDRAAVSGPAPASMDGLAAPTHVLYDGCVYPLGERAFHIGAELAGGEYGLNLGAARAGVSRQHCSIRRGDHGMELVDHSRFGTWLNGHAIERAVVVQAGDIIGVGRPPVELSLVREVRPEDERGGA